MLLKCLIVTIAWIQLFKNKFPVIISSFGPNSSGGFNGIHSDKI